MKKAIYILGGMGPQASIELYRLIVEKSPRVLDAVNNDDYPELVIHSVPVPDFISDEHAKNKALTMLKAVVSSLPVEKFAYFAMACNTAHLLAPELVKSTRIPFISMINEVVNEVRSKGVKKVGLLASPTTIRSRLYQDALAPHHIDVVVPGRDDLQLVESAIRAVISGSPREEHAAQMKQVVARLRANGIKEIVIGCTELPLVFETIHDDHLISSLDVLANSLLNKYKEINNG